MNKIKDEAEGVSRYSTQSNGDVLYPLAEQQAKRVLLLDKEARYLRAAAKFGFTSASLLYTAVAYNVEGYKELARERAKKADLVVIKYEHCLTKAAALHKQAEEV